MSIRALPEGFEKLVNLERESFMACIKQVQYWPESIVEHPHLKDATDLDLSEGNLVALPERFGNLTALTSLDLQYCPAKLTAAMEEQLKAQGCSIQTTDDASPDY